jgi:hypothetical protein
MAKKNVTTSLAEGRKLAVDMLAAFEKRGDEERCALEEKWRRGAPQDNIALPFLQTQCKRPELIEGFASVLTDAITVAGGAIMGADYYRKLDPPLRKSDTSRRQEASSR